MKNKYIKIFKCIIIILYLFPAINFAQTNSNDDEDLYGFGGGIGVTHMRLNLSKKHKVEEAYISGGTVHIKKERHESETDLMGESHFLFEWNDFGIGPFLAVPMSSKTKHGTHLFGVLTGWPQESSKDIFYVGFGRAYAKIRILGNNIEEGEPLPPGEEGIVYKDVYVSGWGIYASLRFGGSQ